MEDVLVGLLDQLLKEPQRHDADLDTHEEMRFSFSASKMLSVYSLTQKAEASNIKQMIHLSCA